MFVDEKQWGKTQKTYSMVAGVAALIGVIVYIMAIHNFSDDVDYANAPQVTEEMSMDEFRSYTGKIIVQGMMRRLFFFPNSDRNRMIILMWILMWLN